MVAKEPNPSKFLKEAASLREQNDTSGALKIVESCLVEFPNVPDVQCLWALLHLDKKDYISAEKGINTAIALNPSQSEYYYICGQIHKAQHHFSTAENAFYQCIKLNPQHEKAYFNLGSLYEKQKKYPEAINMFNKVIELNPKHIKAYYNLGVIYHLQNKLTEAIASYEKGYQLAPDDLPMLSNLGAALTMDRQFSKALPYYERALTLSPDYIPAITNLAGTYIELNELKKAEVLLRRSLELNPRLPTNWRNLTLCRKYELLNDPDLVKILELIEEKISAEDKIQYDFALGKIYHDCQDYKHAFSYYEKGNQLQANKVIYKSEVFANHIQQIIKLDQALPKESFSFPDDNGPQPLIIVGTSRSGKSLLESLLSQDPKIKDKGEVGIGQLVDTIPLEDRPEGSYPYWLRNLTQKQAAILRGLYYKRLSRDGNNTGDYLTDTMPGNFMYLGLIKRLFPKAKFIYCHRSPLDTCVLLYFKYFIQGHAYSYDMKNLATYYQQQARLMDYWQSVLQESIMSVEYEKFVKEPENQLSTINRFLRHDQHFVFNCTLVHADEVGVYKHYAKSFEPVEQILNAGVSDENQISTDSFPLKEYMSKAYYHFNLGDYPAAQNLCELILNQDPSYYSALHLLGVIAFKTQAYEKAIEKLQQAMTHSPPNPQLHLDLGACLQKIGKQAEAQAQFKIADELNMTKSSKPLTLDEQTRNYLLSALLEPLKVIDETALQLLAEGQLVNENVTESFMTPSNEKYFTDLCVGKYRDTNAWHFYYQSIAFADHLLKSPKKNLRILDVGCSLGYFRRFLESNVRNEDNKQLFYWGLDLREDKLKKAIRSDDGLDMDDRINPIPSLFTLQDVQFGLPFRNNFFDYLASFETIPYLSIEQGRLLLAQMYRVLNDEGSLIISTSYQAKYPGFMQSVPIDQFEKMLYENGFEIIERRGSQASLHLLMKTLVAEHVPLVNDLLKVHPPEIVAAMIAPLYPHLTEHVAFLCKVR